MLIQQTLDQRQSLNLSEMARAWQQQQQDPTAAELSFDERFGQLVDAQHLGQHNKRLARLLTEAKLRLPTACVEDLHTGKGRELDKGLLRQLSTCRFIDDKRGVLVVGATGTGKTYLACSLGQQACRRGFRVRYYRTRRLLDELQLARLDGNFLMSPPTEAQRRDLLEVLEDRYGTRSTITTSQFPVESWHAQVGDPTLADALLDRLIHNAYQIVLKGPSIRKDAMKQTPETT